MVKDYNGKDHLIFNGFLFEGYRRFIEGCSKTQTFKDAIIALLDEVETWVGGDFSCCHLSETEGSEFLDIYSSDAKRFRIEPSSTDPSKVPVREDHWLHHLNETEPCYFAGPMIVTCSRRGEERCFQVEGLLSVPVIRSEKVAAVISIGNIGPIDMDMVEKVSLAIDVSWTVIETKRSEEALRESEVRLKQAQRMGKIGNWVWDLERNSLHWSDELYELYGVDKDNFKLTYENILSMLHPADREMNNELVNQVLMEGNGTSFEFRIVRADGTTRDIHQVIDIEKGKGNKITRLIGTMQDITDRKDVEKALAESERRYRAVIEDQTEGISRQLPEGTVTFVNEAFCKMLGRERSDIIGHKWQEFALVDDQKEVLGHLENLSLDEPLKVIENRIVTGDGVVRWIQFVNRGFFDKDGRMVEFQAVGRDITKRKEFERALAESRDQLKVMFDKTNIMMCLLDRDRRVKFFNKAFEVVSGWPETEFRSPFACGALRCVNSQDDPRGCGFGPRCNSCKLFVAIEDTFKTGRTNVGVEYATTLSKGGTRYEVVLLGSTTLVNITGEDMLLLSFQDITELKRIEKELHLSKERYRELFQNSMDPIITLDLDQNIVDLNIAAVRIFGNPLESSKGRKLKDILGMKKVYVDRLVEMVKRGSDRSTKTTIEGKPSLEGLTRFFEVGHYFIKDESGYELVQIVFHDITQSKVLEDQMKRSLLPYKIEDGVVYVGYGVPESSLIELIKELMTIGYRVHTVIRPYKEQSMKRSLDPNTLNLMDRGIMEGGTVNCSRTVIKAAEGKTKGDVLLVDDLGYIILNDGFEEVIKLVQDLRDRAAFFGMTVIIKIDQDDLEEGQIKLLMKECRKLVKGSVRNLSSEQRELIDLILEENLKGHSPDHTLLSSLTGKSKPTIRKNIRALMELGILREHKFGRRKLIEVISM